MIAPADEVRRETCCQCAADHCARPQTVKLSKLRINIKIYVQTVRAHWTDENICELAIFWQVCGLLTTGGGPCTSYWALLFCTNCKTPNPNTTISGRKMFKKKQTYTNECRNKPCNSHLGTFRLNNISNKWGCRFMNHEWNKTNLIWDERMVWIYSHCKLDEWFQFHKHSADRWQKRTTKINCQTQTLRHFLGHTAPQPCQPERIFTLSCILDLFYCDLDEIRRVAG